MVSTVIIHSYLQSSQYIILYLKKFPKIGDKVAKQIILDLKGKLNISVSELESIKSDNTDELIEVLLGLGYKMLDIKRVLPNINKEEEIGNQVKEALRLMVIVIFN